MANSPLEKIAQKAAVELKSLDKRSKHEQRERVADITGDKKSAMRVQSGALKDTWKYRQPNARGGK